MSFLLFLSAVLLLTLDRVLANLSRSALPWYLSPSVWLLVPWVLASGLYALPIIVHRERLELEHVGYIASCLFAYTVGASFAYFKTAPVGPAYEYNNNLELNISRRQLTGLAIAGLVGNMFALYDNIIVTGISLKDRLLGTGLNAAREMNFSAQIQQVVGPYHLLEPLGGLGLIYILCYLSIRFSNEKSEPASRLHFWLLITTILSMTVNSLLVSGGRMALILLALVLWLAVLLDRNKTVFRWLRRRGGGQRFGVLALSAVLTVVVLTALATVYVQKRSGQQSPYLALYLAHRADVEPWVYSATRGMPLTQYGVFSVSYATTPIATLSLYLDLPPQRMPGPFFGQYNFPGIADRIVKRIDKDYFRLWWDARLELFQPMTRDGYGGNVWSTLLRDLAADVGWRVVPLVMFMLGVFTSSAVAGAYRTSNPFKAALAIALLCISAFSVFHSIIYIVTITSLLIYGGLAVLYLWFRGLWKFESKLRVAT